MLSERALEGYRGTALQLLRKFDVKPGQLVEVVTTDRLAQRGLIIPRYLHADEEHIVLKLKSGYNVGIKVSTIESMKSVEETTPVRSVATSRESIGSRLSDKKRLLLISTGGTIASRVDYRTGAVFPILSASDLYAAVPELDRLAVIEPEVVFSVTSENLTPKDWNVLSTKIAELSQQRRPDGIVIMMGTDTLGYTAAALSFSLIGFEIPIVIVGAQRSSDRPSSDAALNLRSAAFFALECKRPGVYVAMHRSENDTEIAIHSGTRVRKNHTSRRDAFESIDYPLVATVINATEIKWNGDSTNPRSHATNYRLKFNFESKVALVKFHPGFDSSVLTYLVEEQGVDGLIIEGTGLGHVSDGTVSVISDLSKEAKFIGITSQCIWGHVDLNVYGPGRDLIAAGAVPLENMIPETAFAKLSWVLGNFPDNIREMMLKNVVGEFNPRILLSEPGGKEN